MAATVELISKACTPTSLNALPGVVSLFSGAGGLDKGLELAGFKTIFATDIHEEHCDTLRRNFPEACVVRSSITELDGKDILSRIGRAVGEVDLVAGGPPCQSFSILGKRKSLKDPRGILVFEFARIVAELRPRAFIFENVKGITTTNAGRDWEELILYFTNKTGYQLHTDVLNAANLGVPQFRERVFIVGLREPNDGFHFPPATHAPTDKALLLGLQPYVTVREALRDLRDLPNHEKRIHGERVAGRYAKISPGGRDRIDHTDRLEWDKPSGTVLVGSSAGGGDLTYILPKTGT